MMKDVFISFSTKDIDVCKSVCRWLKGNGLTYWAYFDYKSDNYQEKIYKGIENCKQCILLISDNSVKSQDVINEVGVISSRKNQEKGMAIFPVYIDEIKDKTKERSLLSYAISIRDSYNWNDKSDKEKLLAGITGEVNKSVTKAAAEEVNSNVPDEIELIGRTQYIEEIENLLDEKKKVYVVGVKGHGKTELLKAVCNRVKERFKVIYYEGGDSIIDAIANDDNIIKHKSLTKKGKKTNNELYHYKLSLLENYIKRNEGKEEILLVFDDCENDRLLKRICNTEFNCRVLVSLSSSKIQKFESILKEGHFERLNIENVCENELKEIFSRCPVKSDDDDFFRRIFAHYLPVKPEKSKETCYLSFVDVCLIAEQMKYCRRAPGNYKRKEEILRERINNIKHIVSNYNESHYIRDRYNKYKSKLRELGERERKLLKILFLIPLDGMSRADFYELLKKIGVEDLMADIKDWYEDNEQITLPLIVRDVIADELPIYSDDSDIRDFIQGFHDEIGKVDDNSYDDNNRLKGLALSIYYMFPDPTIYKYREYLRLNKFFSAVGCFDISREIQNKITKLFPITDKGQTSFPAEAAEAYFQIGLTYDDGGDYSNAIKMFEKAVALYGNRYAAALSHLANAFLLQGDKKLDDLKPYYDESLCLRRKYAEGTISEASSCHLYSKALSELGLGDDFQTAINLSKRAHDLTLERSVENVYKSSMVYNHTWIKIKSLDSEKIENIDVIEKLISELKNAEEIRASGRGKDHNWMEDIYLKLGLSYEKINKLEEAQKYFEKLEKIRTKKYRNKSHKCLIELYSYLHGIYNKLNNSDGMRRCTVYLKSHGAGDDDDV